MKTKGNKGGVLAQVQAVPQLPRELSVLYQRYPYNPYPSPTVLQVQCKHVASKANLQIG